MHVYKADFKNETKKINTLYKARKKKNKMIIKFYTLSKMDKNQDKKSRI